jgi:hypothetical protein
VVLTGVAESIVDGVLVRIVFSALASTIAAPITGLVVAVLYFRLLALKGEQAQAQPQPQPQAASVPQQPGDRLG